MSWSTVGGMSETASRRRCVAHLHRHRAAPTLSRICRASVSGTLPLGRGVEHQRGGVGGGQPVVEPVEAEVGDRRHIDQHFGEHHEQDREHEELAGQAEARECSLVVASAAAGRSVMSISLAACASERASRDRHGLLFRPHPEEHPCKSIDLHGCVSKTVCPFP